MRLLKFRTFTIHSFCYLWALTGINAFFDGLTGESQFGDFTYSGFTCSCQISLLRLLSYIAFCYGFPHCFARSIDPACNNYSAPYALYRSDALTR